MRTVFDANIVPIIIALLVGLLVGWWIFKRARTTKDGDSAHRRSDTAADSPTAAAPTQRVSDDRPVRAGIDGPEGNGLVDQGAAAMTDVAGEVLGVEAHSQLPNASGPPDDLEIMKGVGPKFVTRLHENGITRFEQLARLSDNEVTILDDKLGPFKGRLRRDRVVEQASYLARGDTDGFEARFGKLGSGS